MKIEILKFSLSDLSILNISDYLDQNYSEKILVRAFISSLYFDTLSVEILFL